MFIHFISFKISISQMIPEDLCPRFPKSMKKSRKITDQFVIVQFWIEIKCELINHNLPPVQRQIPSGIIKVTIKSWDSRICYKHKAPELQRHEPWTGYCGVSGSVTRNCFVHQLEITNELIMDILKSNINNTTFYSDSKHLLQLILRWNFCFSREIFVRESFLIN